MSLQNTVLFGAVLVFTAALILTLNSSQMHQSKHSIFLATLPMVGGLELDDLWGSFQFKPFHDSMTLCIHPCVISVIKQRSTALFPSDQRSGEGCFSCSYGHCGPISLHQGHTTSPKKAQWEAAGMERSEDEKQKDLGHPLDPSPHEKYPQATDKWIWRHLPKVNLTPSPSGYYSTISNHASFPHSSYQT